MAIVCIFNKKKNKNLKTLAYEICRTSTNIKKQQHKELVATTSEKLEKQNLVVITNEDRGNLCERN